jgi:hypothetical protein
MARGRSLGRGVLNRGRWAEPREAPPGRPPPIRRLTVPFEFPNWALNKWSIRAFNALIYHAHAWNRSRTSHPESFFYPLDKILQWNRIYGPRGFTQYQCVLPDSAGPGAARRFFRSFIGPGAPTPSSASSRTAPRGKGILSFPRPGSPSPWTSPSTRHPAHCRSVERGGDRRGRPHLPGEDSFTAPSTSARWTAAQKWARSTGDGTPSFEFGAPSRCVSSEIRREGGSSGNEGIGRPSGGSRGKGP